MGTWAAGPFGNDSSLDFVADVLDMLMKPVDDFMESPEIDESFDDAFAAVALINAVIEQTPSRPYRGSDVLDGRPIREAMLRCFDEHIDDLEPEPEFKKEHREALAAALDRFVALLSSDG